MKLFKDLESTIQTSPEELEAKIKESAQKYYTDGSQNMTDAEFDSLVEQLQTVKPDSEVLATGWGYSVQSASSDKFPHKYGLVGSLPKCRSYDELKSDFRGRRVIASLKLDGISVVLYYEKGHLVQALTRGDGTEGIDITEKALTITSGSIQDLDDNRFTGAVRGEIVMSFNNFSKYLESNPDASNPRNVTAGIISKNEPTQRDLELLDIVVYTVVGIESGFDAFQDYYSILLWLNFNFSNVVEFKFIELFSDTFIEEMECCSQEWSDVYPSDGIVLCKDFKRVKHQIEYNSIAFKFPAEKATTTVTEIEWNMTKTDYCVPRIRFTPVRLSGTTVEWATGFNAKFIADNKIGVGAEIVVTKSGEIIPYVLEVSKPVEEVELPKLCPKCGNELIQDGVHLVCVNYDCPSKHEHDLLIWITELTNHDGLGDTLILKFIQDLIDNNYMSGATIEELMNSRHEEAIEYLSQQGVQGARFANMLQELFYRDSIPFECALKALNIPRLGDKTCAKIAVNQSAADAIIRSILICDRDKLNELTALVGNATVTSMKQNFSKMARMEYVIDRLKPVESIQLTGSVAITGKLSVPRNKFEEELRQFGYEVKGISKNTICLITDNPNSDSSKNKKADELGIPKLTEMEFRRKYM